jgi:hypothetical protein
MPLQARLEGDAAAPGRRRCTQRFGFNSARGIDFYERNIRPAARDEELGTLFPCFAARNYIRAVPGLTRREGRCYMPLLAARLTRAV